MGVSYLTSLSLSCLICKMMMVIYYLTHKDTDKKVLDKIQNAMEIKVTCIIIIMLITILSSKEGRTGALDSWFPTRTVLSHHTVT